MIFNADLTAIRAREADPAMHEHAERVAHAINERIDTKGMNALASQARAANSVKAKIILLRRMTDKIGEAGRGLVPCRKGCSHCCHMATMVHLDEAKMIAAATGARMVMPKAFNVDLVHIEKLRNRYDGVPCRFLVNSACSIYEQRPLACRMHMIVDRDETLCQIVPGEKIRVPMIDTLQYDLAITKAFGGPLNMKYADIREYFPPKTNKGK
jgi:Fe-S-cluster containining protein